MQAFFSGFSMGLLIPWLIFWYSGDFGSLVIAASVVCSMVSHWFLAGFFLGLILVPLMFLTGVFMALSYWHSGPCCFQSHSCHP